MSTLSGRFDAKNLLDDPYETVQGTVTRESYHDGPCVPARSRLATMNRGVTASVDARRRDIAVTGARHGHHTPAVT